MKIIESDRHVSTVLIAQELNIAQITVWNHLKRLDSKGLQVNAKRNLNNLHIRIAAELQQNRYISEAASDNVQWKSSWLKSGELSQKVAKPGLKVRKVVMCLVGIIRYQLLPTIKLLIRIVDSIATTEPTERSNLPQAAIFGQLERKYVPSE